MSNNIKYNLMDEVSRPLIDDFSHGLMDLQRQIYFISQGN